MKHFLRLSCVSIGTLILVLMISIPTFAATLGRPIAPIPPPLVSLQPYVQWNNPEYLAIYTKLNYNTTLSVDAVDLVGGVSGVAFFVQHTDSWVIKLCKI